MNAPSIDLADFPIVAHPVADKKAGPHTIRELAICLAAKRSLGLPKDISLDADEGYATLNYRGSGSRESETVFRLRINGFAHGQGSKKTREYLSISMVGLAGDEVVGWSEDVATTPRGVGLLTFVGADGEETPITAALRALVASKATPPAVKPKKKKEPSAAKGATAALVLVADSPIRSVDLSPDGAWIATTHQNQRVVLWDAATGRASWSATAGGSGMQHVKASAFSPDGRSIASGATTLKLFDVATREAVAAPAGHPKGELADLAWGAVGLVTASAKNVVKADNSLALWNPTNGKLIKQWEIERLKKVDLLPGAEPAIVALTENGLCRIEVAGDEVENLLEETCYAFAVTAQGVWALTEEELLLLDLKTFKPLRKLASEGRIVLAANLSGSLLMSAAGGNRVGEQTRLQRLDAKSGKVVADWALPAGIPGMQEHLARVMTVERAKGRYFSKYDDAVPSLVDLTVSQAGDRVVAATEMVMAVWSPDGKVVLSPSAV